MIFACWVCGGNASSPLTKAAWGGMWLLFGIVMMVLGGILATGISWALRARRLRRPL